MGNKSTEARKLFVMRAKSLLGDDSEVAKIHVLKSYRSGGDTPNFRALAEKGVFCTNFMTGERKDASFIPSFVMYISTANGSLKGKTGWTEMHHPFPVDATSFDPSVAFKASNDAATQIRKKIQAETSTFSGPTFLGELRETAQMIRKPAKALSDYLNKSITNATRKAKKQKNPKRKGSNPLQKDSLAKAASDTWLEIAFGAAPLVNDIGAIAEASLRRYEEPRIKRVSAVGFGEASQSTAIRPGSGPNYVMYNRNIEQTEIVQVKYIAGIKTTVSRSNNGLERVIEQSRMNWSEIIPTAWELVPWSFLVDYFGNIGDVLNAASVSLSNVAWSQKTTRCEYRTLDVGISMINYSSSQNLVTYRPGQSRSFKATVVREAASIPIPDLRFELPGRKGQLLNIAALLGSKFL